MLSARTTADNRLSLTYTIHPHYTNVTIIPVNSSGMSGTTINTSIRIVLSCFLFRQLKFSLYFGDSPVTFSDSLFLLLTVLIPSIPLWLLLRRPDQINIPVFIVSIQIPLNRTCCVTDLIPCVHNPLDKPHATLSLRPHKYIITASLPDVS